MANRTDGAFVFPTLSTHICVPSGVYNALFNRKQTQLAPGAWASQRHWHQHEDELVYVLESELVLVEDAGEALLRPGESGGWPAGVPDGHHLQNRSQADATFLVVGTRKDEDAVLRALRRSQELAGAASVTCGIARSPDALLHRSAGARVSVGSVFP